MTKPFNLADAKAGHPVTTDSGESFGITLYDFDFELKSLGAAIMGVVSGIRGFPQVAYWNQEGAPMHGTYGDLVMAPLGTVSGKEVYPGDMLSYRGAGPSPVPHGFPFEPEAWAWPTRYPETAMTGNVLRDIYVNDKGEPSESMLVVANAAIRHGIDNGYLLDPNADADSASGLVRGRILAEIARGLGWTGHFTYADIPAAVRQREVAIAHRAYTDGCAHVGTYGITDIGFIESIIAKVK